MDTKGKILTCNQAFIELWHMPGSVIENKDDNAALVHAMSMVEDGLGFMKKIQALYAGQKAASAKDVLHLKDGRIVERMGKSVIGNDGIWHGWAWHFRDITEQHRNEQELQRQKNLYRDVLEGISDAFVSFDFDWNILYINGKAATWGNLLPAEVLGRNLWEAFPQLLKTGLASTYHESMETRQARQTDYFSASVNRWYSVKIAPITQGLSVFITDITDTKKVEEEKKDQEDQFRSMSDFMPQMVWATDSQGNHDFYNKRWYEFTGLSYDETKDTGWSLVLHPDDSESTWKKWNHSLQTGDLYETEYRMKRADGAYRWLLVRAMPMRNEGGEIIRWFGTCTDIHDQKLASDLLEMKVAERTRDLLEANTYLQSVNEELRQFNYVASHDLQEPLRKIMIFAERIKAQDFEQLSESSRTFLDRMSVSAERMSVLLKDLLNFSSTQREDLFSPVNLNDTIGDVESDLELMIAQNSALLHKQELPTLRAIPLQMHQLFYNLINNALKFTSPHRRPVVRVQGTPLSPQTVHAWSLPPELNYYHFTVEDNGIGFEPEFNDRIFVLFKRLHNQQTFRGTGVGLALCKKVVENHQGRIWAESQPGQGATFHVVLPML